MPELEHETENRILEAAHAVFVRRGTAGARMQEIASEAGVNQALLHYYYRSKSRLAEAVFLRAARALLPPVMATLASDSPIDEKVRRVVEIEFEILSHTPNLPAYVLSEINHQPGRAAQLARAIVGPDVDALIPGMFATLTGQIEEQVAAGTMRPIGADQFVVNLVALCLFPFAAKPLLNFLLETSGGGFDEFISRRKEELPTFFLNALRP